MEVNRVTPSNVHPTPGYSPAVRLGNLVFASGQVPLNQKGELVGKGDVRAQAEQVYANLRAVLEAAGSGLDLVGKITVLSTSLEHRPVLGEVRNKVFGPTGHLPASTFVVISSLANPDFMVEIEAVALVRQ